MQALNDESRRKQRLTREQLVLRVALLIGCFFAAC
jgi:hypothetical protein